MSRRHLRRVIARDILASLLWGNRAESLRKRRDWLSHARGCATTHRRGSSPQPCAPAGRHVTRRTPRRGWLTPATRGPRAPPSTPRHRRFFPGAAEPCHKEASARGGADRGRGDPDGPPQPRRLDAPGPWTAWDVWAVRRAALASAGRGLDAWARRTASGGVVRAAGRRTPLGAQGLVEALPGAPGAPGAARPGHPGPLGLGMGPPPPWEAPGDDRPERLDARPHRPRAVAPTRLGGWEAIFQTLPGGIRAVCGVWIGVHPPRVLS